MPCFLFTFHTYGSWMPDREEGYVRRHEGILPPSRVMARRYQRVANEAVAVLTDSLQRVVIDETLIAAGKQNFRVHYVATETTHAHVLVSWRDERPWIKLRNGLKSSLSRRLKKESPREKWLTENASRKRVTGQEHFDYLVSTYLPSHRGWKWSEDKGLFK